MKRLARIDFDKIRAALRRGWLRDLPDFRDLVASEILPLNKQLPNSVDLSADCSPVENQLSLGSCTAQMLAGVAEFLLKQQGRFVDVSRLALYYAEREAMGTVDQDSGASIRQAFKILAQVGAADESLWPYLVEKFTVRPADAVYADARTRTLAEYRRVCNTNRLHQVMVALSSGLPVGFGFSVYSSAMKESVAKTGVIPMPTLLDSLEGGHAVMAVGYDKASRHLKFRNSWGEEWGEDGYGWLPFEYVSLPTLSNDYWIGTQMKVSQ